MASAAEPSPRVSATASSSPAGIVNPNTPPPAPQPQQSWPVFDVKKLAAMTRPAVALVTVLDKAGKPLKLGTGFFVSADGKFVTNAHLIEGADTASAKLENGATYLIRGVLKPAVDKGFCCSKPMRRTYSTLPSVASHCPTLDRELL